jgi:hypothetical protein
MNGPAIFIKYAEVYNENLMDDSEETQNQFTVQKQTLDDSLNIFSHNLDTPGSLKKTENYHTPQLCGEATQIAT